LESNKIAFIAMLRELTGCGLEDAKGTMLHIATKADNCHWCHQPIPPEGIVADCPWCRSLNVRLIPTATMTGEG
jgi:Zn finger protein HypA/HybF involved in hydrogenase expression